MTVAEKAPTQIPLKTPLPAAPEPGGSITFLACEFPQCQTVGKAIKEAAAAANWTYNEIAYKSADPGTLVSGLQQALAGDPSAVALTAIPRAVWESVIPAYKKAGVPIVAGFLGDAQLDDTVIASIAGPDQFRAYGSMVGNWFIAQSEAEGKAILVNYNDFPAAKAFSDGVREAVSAGCDACSLTDLNLTAADAAAGKSNGAIVSALQRSQDAKFVLSSYAAFVAGLPAALAAANLDGIQIAEGAGGSDALTNLKQKTILATTGVAFEYSGWAMFDAVLRHAQDAPVPTDEYSLPAQLLTAETPFTIGESYNEPADYRDQLKGLWQLQ